MSKLDLTAERLRTLLNYQPETGVFTWKVRTTNSIQVGDKAGSATANGYLRIRVDGRSYLAHRIAWLYVHGAWPTEDLDHINRVRDDCRLVNLRLASRSENMQNSSLARNNSSGHKGISWSNTHQRWQVSITHQKRRLHLGYFHDVREAVSARKQAEVSLHPFAAS